MSTLSPERARELMQKMRDAAAGTTGREMHVCVNSGDLTDLLQHLECHQPRSEGLAGLREVMLELGRAVAKFPAWPTDPLHALAVLGEEFGELTKDVLQLTYEPHKTSAHNVRAEAVQTAAMALRFAASLHRYEYKPAKQHPQILDAAE